MLTICSPRPASGGEPMKHLTERMHAIMRPRKYRRYRLDVPVIFSWKDAHEIRQEHLGLTRDVSVGGAFVVVTTPPPLDANIELKGLRLPCGQSLPMRMFGQGQGVRLEPALGSLPAGFAVAGGRIVFHRWAED
jgi:hypothetical protein